MAQFGNMTPSKEVIAAYIAEAARARGVDPSVAVAVARSEGLNASPSDGWQSNYVKDGKRERSYGPFQLYIDGGLGNEFMESTKLDPRDPSTWQAQVDFSLDHAAKSGWGAWYGAANTGIGNMQGIGGGAIPSSPQAGMTPFNPEGLLAEYMAPQESNPWADAGGVLADAFAAPEAAQMSPMQATPISRVQRENPYINFFNSIG